MHKNGKILFMFITCILIIGGAGCLDNNMNNGNSENNEEMITSLEVKNKTIDKYNDSDSYSYVQEVNEKSVDSVVSSEVMYKKPDHVKMAMYDENDKKVSTSVTNGDTIISHESSSDYAVEQTDSENMDIRSDNPYSYYTLINQFIDSEYENSTLETNGSLDGDDVYTLTLEFEMDQNNVNKIKTWIDKDSYQPLKYELYEDSEVVTEVTFNEFKFNGDISDKEFEYEPPENVSVKSMDELQPEETSLDNAADEMNFDVKAPKHIPDGMERESTKINKVDSSVDILYSDNNSDMRFVQVDTDRDLSIPEGDDEKINGETGNFVSGESNLLSWGDDVTYILVSEDINKDELINVAESLESVK